MFCLILNKIELVDAMNKVWSKIKTFLNKVKV